MKVTIKDIAEIAGVHRSTVDKVLHNRPGVSSKVRERVKEIIEELGYEPNKIGKALAHQKKPIKISIVLFDFDALEEIKRGIEEAYKEYKAFGLQIEYFIIKSFDPIEQLNTIHFLKTRNISGLIISALNTNEIREALDELIESGIPVVTTNIDVPESKRLAYVGQNLYKAGEVAGQLMGESLNGVGKVAIITDSIYHSHLYKRQLGFEKVIESDYPNLEIEEVVETQEQKLPTFQKTVSLIERVENLSGIFVTCGCVSEVGKAIKVMNKENQIKVITNDVFRDIIELVRENIINFTLSQDLYNQGYKPVKILFELLFNKRPPNSDNLTTSIDIKIKTNIDE